MHYLAIVENLRVPDIIDILFLTVVVYYLYSWFRGTKAIKALIGLLALGIIYTIARSWGLFLTTWVFQILWQVLVILLIILFQSEIRQVLEKVNPLQIIGIHNSGAQDWVPGFVEAFFLMAKRRIGALAILERRDRVQEWTTACIPLAGAPTPEILLSVFQKDSPLHDGAVLIQDGKIVSTSCFLPLSSAEGLPKEWGTRHRAALGLSERCDAWVVAVSEERGELSVAQGGKMVKIDTAGKLSELVRKAVSPPAQKNPAWGARVRSMLTNRWKAKLGTLAMVTVIWMVFAGEQNFQVSVQVPLETKDLPAQLTIVEPKSPSVQVTVQGLRKDASILSKNNVHAAINLSLARPGSLVYNITRGNISLPNDQLRIVNIRPSQMTFQFKKAS